MRNQLERQLLNIEGMVQLKNQAEASSKFIEAMNAVSKSIAALFGKIDIVQTQEALEKAQEQAQTLEEEMNMLLDETTENIYSSTAKASKDSVPDEEFERLIEDEFDTDVLTEILLGKVFAFPHTICGLPLFALLTRPD
jgi:hypothetical protein